MTQQPVPGARPGAVVSLIRVNRGPMESTVVRHCSAMVGGKDGDLTDSSPPPPPLAFLAHRISFPVRAPEAPHGPPPSGPPSRRSFPPHLRATLKDQARRKNANLPGVDNVHLEMAQFLASTPWFQKCAIPSSRILDAITYYDNGGSRCVQVEYRRGHVLWQQSKPVNKNGIYFVYTGSVKFVRKSMNAYVDALQQSLIAKGAFDKVLDLKDAFRQPKSSDKEWEVGTAVEGDMVGEEAITEQEVYQDSARVENYAKLIFVPLDVFATRLIDVNDHLQAEACLRVRARNRQFDRIQAVFQREAEAQGGRSYSPVRDRKTVDSGEYDRMSMITKDLHVKRYFRKNSGLIYSGTLCLRPGEVPAVMSRIQPSSQLCADIDDVPKHLVPDGKAAQVFLPDSRIVTLYKRFLNRCSVQSLRSMYKLVEDENTFQDQFFHNLRKSRGTPGYTHKGVPIAQVPPLAIEKVHNRQTRESRTWRTARSHQRTQDYVGRVPMSAK